MQNNEKSAFDVKTQVHQNLKKDDLKKENFNVGVPKNENVFLCWVHDHSPQVKFVFRSSQAMQILARCAVMARNGVVSIRHQPWKHLALAMKSCDRQNAQTEKTFQILMLSECSKLYRAISGYKLHRLRNALGSLHVCNEDLCLLNWSSRCGSADVQEDLVKWPPARHAVGTK